MSDINNGGPAFPGPTLRDTDGEIVASACHGMSLRDYFAAKAMQGIWSNVEVLRNLPNGDDAMNIARLAYEQADAMLKARIQP